MKTFLKSIPIVIFLLVALFLSNLIDFRCNDDPEPNPEPYFELKVSTDKIDFDLNPDSFFLLKNIGTGSGFWNIVDIPSGFDVSKINSKLLPGGIDTVFVSLDKSKIHKNGFYQYVVKIAYGFSRDVSMESDTVKCTIGKNQNLYKPIVFKYTIEPELEKVSDIERVILFGEYRGAIIQLKNIGFGILDTKVKYQKVPWFYVIEKSLPDTLSIQFLGSNIGELESQIILYCNDGKQKEFVNLKLTVLQTSFSIEAINSVYDKNGWEQKDGYLISKVKNYTDHDYPAEFTFNLIGVKRVTVWADILVRNQDSFWIDVEASNTIKWRDFNLKYEPGWNIIPVYQDTLKYEPYIFDVTQNEFTVKLYPRANKVPIKTLTIKRVE